MNIGQKNIRSKIVSYLTLHRRDADLIQKFKKGCCNGFASIALYAQYLEHIQQTTKPPSPIDDWTWFESTLHCLDNWDNLLSSLTTENKQDIERLISLIEYFQNIDNYLPIGQSNLQDSLCDTKSRTLKLEYAIGGLLLGTNLTQQFTLPDKTKTSILSELLKHQGRLVLISSARHTTCLFRNGDTVSFYDPNCHLGRNKIPLHSLSKISDALFHACSYSRSKPSPLGFRVFSFDPKPDSYVPAQNLLHFIGSEAHCYQYDYANCASALYVATRIGSTACVDYYLQHGAAVDIGNNKNETPLYLAVSRRHRDVIKQLVAAGANINREVKSAKTPLIRAAANNDIETLLLLFDRPNNAKIKHLITALHSLENPLLRPQLIGALDKKTYQTFFENQSKLKSALARYQKSKRYQQEIYLLLAGCASPPIVEPENYKYIADIYRLFSQTTPTRDEHTEEKTEKKRFDHL